MPRFLSVLEIWRFGSRHRPVPEAQSDEQHTQSDTGGEMAANQMSPQVANKLLSPDTSAVQPWLESTSEEQNVPSQGDDCSGYDDVRADTFCGPVIDLLPFTNSQMEDSLNDSESHNLIWSSEAHHITRKGEVAQPRPGLSAPVVLPWDSNSSCIGTQPVGLMQTKAKAGHFASNELWLNAGQVPAGEEEGTILDERNTCSDVTSFAGGRTGDREESGYPLGTEAAIGLPSDDSRLRTPPVETWSSTDSRAGTHSNTVHIVLPSPDESPATVIQTLEAMAVKDREPESLQGQENNDTAEQTCLITDAKDDGELTAVRGVERVQTLLKSQAGNTSVHSPDLRDKGDKESPLTEEQSFLQTSEEERCSSLPCAVASHNVCESDTACILPSSEDITVVVSDIVKHLSDARERTPVGGGDMDTYRKKKTPSQASEVERCQGTSEEPQTPEPETGAPREVTEDTISPLHLDVKNGVESETSAAEPVRGEEPARSVERLQRAEEAVHTSLQRQAEETGFGATQKDKPLHAGPQGETNERPGFIMPLAPLCQRSSHVHAGTASERGQQRTRFVKTARNGAFDRTRPFSSENQAETLLAVGKGEAAHSVYPPGGHYEKLTCSGQSLDEGSLKPSSPGESQQPSSRDTKSCEASWAVSHVSKELSKLFIPTGNKLAVCEEDKTAYITLDLDDDAGSVTSFGVENGNWVDRASPLEHIKTEKTPSIRESEQKRIPKMSRKTPSGCKTLTGHKGKEKPTSRQEKSKQADAQASKAQQGPLTESLVIREASAADSGSNDASVVVIETMVITEKITRSSSKKKKKQSQHASAKVEAEPSKAVESSAQPKTPKGKTDDFDASPAVRDGSNNDKPPALTSKTDCSQVDNLQRQSTVKDALAAKRKDGPVDNLASAAGTEGSQSAGLAKQPGEGVLKRRHLFEDKGGKRPAELKAQKPSPLAKRDEHAAPAEAGQRKSYSEVVKQKTPAHKEVPKVLQNLTAETPSDDPRSINLWCQFSALSAESFVVWTKEGVTLTQAKRSTGDESRLSFQVSKASSKDLGRYQCCLSSPLGRLTSEFHLTSDVLNELIPCQNHSAEAGEDVRCAPLLFKGDFPSERYFGENQPASIMTEEAHFGEGMHRRAFRTKLLSGTLSPFAPGHPCVLKVHNAVSQGTNSSEDLVLKNYDLAVEECHVQNTAREYIKAYTTTAKSAEEFGEVPEIIPIFLVHRPSNDIPYATLEEELMGDFVKYSVKDGKEINLKRQDSEPGQKCCAFQHWVYNMTEGNLLVTDMQGVGMKLTDVGIATPKKGYKGFKGNCATSFIDQFQALHQCNKFCELLGLKSLQPSQPRPRKAATAPKPKPQPQPKKKVLIFGLKSKT